MQKNDISTYSPHDCCCVFPRYYLSVCYGLFTLLTWALDSYDLRENMSTFISLKSKRVKANI